MSMRLILILSVLLLSVTAADTAAAPAPAAKGGDKAAGGDKKEKKDSEKKDDKKMKIEGGLYTTDKVANVKSNKGNRPVSNCNMRAFCLTFYFIRQ